MMETGSVVWRGVCCGIIGALLWFGLASPQPFRRNRDDGEHEIRQQVGKSLDGRPAAPRHTHHGGLPACRGALNACQENLGMCQSELGDLDASLEMCQSDSGKLDASLEMCQSDLGSLNERLGLCQSALGTSQADLGTCDENLVSCQSELGTCKSDLGNCDADLAQAQKFPATGQMDCWGFGGDPTPCAGTGHDGNVQAGALLDYVDNGDGTVTDENTGLMWEKLCDEEPEPGGGTCPAEHDVGTPYRWEEAFEKIAMLNTEPCFATYCDWRLPNVKELLSIVNYQKFNPAVSPAFDNNCNGGIPPFSCTVTACSCTALRIYWSSTSHPQDPRDAWGVHFAEGTVGFFPKSISQRVRAVRGP